MKVICFMLLDMLFLVHLFPTKLGFPNDVVETLRPYYYKILRFLVRPTTEKNQGVIAEKSLEIRPSKYSDAESKMMKLLEDASDAERENSETTLEKVDERLRRFNPGEYSQQELMAMMKKKQKLKESFADHARKPYWVGGDQLFNRTVQHREINTTLARGTDVATQTYSFIPTTWSPDCNQHCSKFYTRIGLVCAQRWVEKRKETVTFDLFGVSWLTFDWLVGWWFNNRDRQDILEFRQFNNICDMEYENCRNSTHNPSWFPTHFSHCDGSFHEPSFIKANIIKAKKLLDNKVNDSTQIWD